MAIRNGSPTSCCTSDSDSNASLESADGDGDADARRPKGKGRAGRSATTEPQSIYARVLNPYDHPTVLLMKNDDDDKILKMK